jgi:phytoene/squalene synthetase
MPAMTLTRTDSTTASSARLAASITRRGSRRTYDIIRWLVDRGRIDDAMRAYAYFRWVDDTIDITAKDQASRLRFVERQRILLDRLTAGEMPGSLARQERILADLLASDFDGHPGLRSYLDKMMAVMEFDAARCGQWISAADLERYSDLLSTAVMDALTYFIGHTTTYPDDPSRTLAVRGAHIAHMLRDTVDDLRVGYVNVPCETLQTQQLSPDDFAHPAYRDWVRQRVTLGQACFSNGKHYILRVRNLRAQLAGFMYCWRFENILRTIRRNDYLLRPKPVLAAYPSAWQVTAAHLLRHETSAPRRNPVQPAGNP